ncbi:MAG: putative toxin-antitoxin system toxin component, PIN family [Snowella sp.]|nr:putative toxin-antitoxin system toxin component, PIN family [Snowella sp.]
MNLKTIVVDTNVVISAVLNPLGTPNQAFTKAITYFQLIQSESTYEELVTRLQKRKFDRYISLEDRADFLEMIHRKSLFFESEFQVNLCDDLDDNKFLDLARVGSSIYLITGDSDLLILQQYLDTQIIKPAQFLDLLI